MRAGGLVGVCAGAYTFSSRGLSLVPVRRLVLPLPATPERSVTRTHTNPHYLLRAPTSLAAGPSTGATATRPSASMQR